MARPDIPPRSGRLAAVLGVPSGPGRAALGATARTAGRAAGRAPEPGAARDLRRQASFVDPPTVPELDVGGVQPAPAAPDRRHGVARALRSLLPASWRGARLDPGRPGATALALVAAAAAVVAAVGVWSERPRAEPVGALPAVTVGPDPAASAPPAADGPPTAEPAPAAPFVVSVSGKVTRPGLVEVPAGSRVADVLDAAGGALPGTDLTALNLARRVADGEQVAVGVPAAPDAAPAGPAAAEGGGPGGAAPGGKVDLNAATLQQLDTLPGVGPVTAQHILDWRTRNGRFTRVEQLREVDGIGERRFGQLRELVTVP